MPNNAVLGKMNTVDKIKTHVETAKADARFSFEICVTKSTMGGFKVLGISLTFVSLGSLILYTNFEKFLNFNQKQLPELPAWTLEKRANCEKFAPKFVPTQDLAKDPSSRGQISGTDFITDYA